MSPALLEPASFNGRGKIDLERWFTDVEAFMAHKVEDKSTWATHVLQHHIAEPVRQALERIRLVIIEKADKDVLWTWGFLKEALIGAQAQIGNASVRDISEVKPNTNINVPWTWDWLKETLVGAQAQIQDASVWDKFVEANKDVPWTWDSLKDTLGGAQAQAGDASARLWDRFKEADKSVPLTWDSLKDTLVGEQTRIENASESLWNKLKEVNKDVPWTWDSLKETLIEVQAQIGDGSLWERVNDIHAKHRSELVAATLPLAVTGAVCLAPFVVIAVLGVIGFSAAGPVAGSIAAAAQSGIGLVEAGSAFALAQSISMTPAILAAANGGVILCAGALTTAGVLAYYEKAPFSVTWDDGENFQPSPELVERLVGDSKE